MGYETDFLSEYEEVHRFSSGGYEWAELRVFEKDGRLFAAESCGCSCTDFESNVVESDLTELQSLESAKNMLKDFLDSNLYYFSDQISTYLDGVEKFRELGLR